MTQPSQQAQMGPIWAKFGASGHMWAWALSGLICGLHMGPIWAAHVFFIFLLDDIRYAWEPLKPYNCCNLSLTMRVMWAPSGLHVGQVGPSGLHLVWADKPI